MAYNLLGKKSKQTEQPGRPTSIHFNNPLTNNLKFCVKTTNFGFDNVSGSFFSRSGNIGYEYDGLNFKSANSNIAIPATAKINTSDAFTILVVIRPIAINGTHQMLISDSSSAVYIDILGDKLSYRHTADNTVASGSIALSNNSIYSAILVKNGTSIKTWINGISDISSTIVNTDISTANLVIGDNGFSLPFDGSILLSAGFNKGFSNSEAISLSSNPWQLFKSKSIPIFYGDSGTPYLRNSSLNSLLQKTIGTTASIQAQLQKQALTQIATLGSQLSKTTLLTASAQAQLLKTLYTTATLDSRLLKQVLQIANIDSNLQKQLTNTLNAGAVLQKVNILNFLLGALLQKSRNNTVTLDATLLSSGSPAVFATLNALLQKLVTSSATLEAKLQKEGVASSNINATLSKIVTVTSTVDGKLQRNIASTSSMQAQLAKTITKSLALDAILLSISGTIVLSTINAILQKNVTNSAQLNAALSKLNITVTSVNSVLSKNNILTGSTSAYVQKTLSAVSTLDATLIDGLVGAKAYLEARLQKTLGLTSSLSAFLITALHAIDACIEIAVLNTDTTISILDIDTNIWVNKC